MITSRGLSLLKASCRYSLAKKATTNLQPSRSSHFGYRKVIPASRACRMTTEALAGILWWWIFWHFWHDMDHITGEFEYPDVSKWTDEELGIPPDDE